MYLNMNLKIQKCKLCYLIIDNKIYNIVMDICEKLNIIKILIFVKINKYNMEFKLQKYNLIY